jgi:hypothetical protein
MLAAGFKMEEAKAVFFDSERVMKEMDARTRRTLSRFGAYCRKVAQNSIKTSADAAAPGQPPHAHAGSLPKFKKGILFAADLEAGSVVIGPIAYNQVHGYLVPQVLEEGGDVTARVRILRHLYSGREKKFAMVKRHYRPHPFMGPAFQRSLEKLGTFYEQSRAA